MAYAVVSNITSMRVRIPLPVYASLAQWIEHSATNRSLRGFDPCMGHMIKEEEIMKPLTDIKVQLVGTDGKS